ncbi:ddb1 and cul4 associated factor 7, partial [Blyttiomyces sp. JEL0837]
MGFSSFVEEYTNKIHAIQLFDRGGDFVKIAEIDHNYPVTKLLWSPYKGGLAPDLLATTGDYLRIYELVNTDLGGVVHGVENMGMNGGGASSHGIAAGSAVSVGPHEGQFQFQCRATLANMRRVGSKKDQCAPLTSFDWNESDPSLCVTSSIDTTCTVWDINTQQAKTQLIAHDKEVYDVAFARGTDIFASVGADGSVRMFDLRALEHSTILYETPGVVVNSSHPNASAGGGGGGGGGGSNLTVENPPLLRLAWNKQDPNYIATFQMASSSVLILDVRVPAVPVAELQGHASSVNALAWAPQSSAYICSV